MIVSSAVPVLVTLTVDDEVLPVATVANESEAGAAPSPGWVATACRSAENCPALVARVSDPAAAPAAAAVKVTGTARVAPVARVRGRCRAAASTANGVEVLTPVTVTFRCA